MGILDRFRRNKPVTKRRSLSTFLPGGTVPRNSSSGGGFYGAVQDRLTEDFKGSDLSADAAAYQSLEKLRARSRQLCMSNPYAKRFVSMVVSNVLGTDGIRLEARTKRDFNGDLDLVDNATLEQAWANWAKPKSCSITGQLNLRDLQRISLAALCRDGEVFLRIHKVDDNPYGISVEVKEGDSLMVRHNQELDNGDRIVMGIEQTIYGKPIAYHFLVEDNTHNPAQTYSASRTGNVRTERVPADEVIHLYIHDRPGQSRGIPWMAQSMRGLHMTESYREAELVAARVAASKMAFYTSQHGDGYTGDDIDQDGSLVFEAEAGLIEQLPEGVSLETLDWSHPNSNMGDFTKACLRGVASGLGVSYNALSNDLEGVNFSSIRAGVQEEREIWKTLQSFMSDHLMNPLFEIWLDSAMLNDAVPFPPRKRDKYLEIIWRPRGFSYVDPVKDQQAFEKAVSLGVMSRSEIAAQQGKDFRDVLEELAKEEQLAYELGVNVSPRQTMPIYPAMQDPEAQAKGEFSEEDAQEEVAEE